MPPGRRPGAVALRAALTKGPREGASATPFLWSCPKKREWRPKEKRSGAHRRRNCLLRVSACREWSSRYRMGVQHRRPRLASLRSRRWVCGNSKPPLPCRGGGACAAGDGGVLGLCASLLRTADFRHPSGRACARPPPLQCRGGLGSRPLSAATAGRNARTAMQKTHSPTG